MNKESIRNNLKNIILHLAYATERKDVDTLPVQITHKLTPELVELIKEFREEKKGSDVLEAPVDLQILLGILPPEVKEAIFKIFPDFIALEENCY